MPILIFDDKHTYPVTQGNEYMGYFRVHIINPVVMAWLEDHKIGCEVISQFSPPMIKLHNCEHQQRVQRKFKTTLYKNMLTTINRPPHTYDQFTNNPLKLIAQAWLPLKILRNLWNATTYSVNIPEKFLTPIAHPYMSADHMAAILNPELQTWLTKYLPVIKIWYDRNTVRIQFKYEDDAALFKLTWSV
jgi:hypothetical protein